MAIYSTFFACDPEALQAAFPGWKRPLQVPVEVERFDPFTGEQVTVKSSAPEWDDVDPESLEMPEYQVVAIEGDYGEYLEQRIPSFVRSQPHWCAKGLTNIEIEALAAVALNLEEVSLETALYPHPALAAGLMQLPDDFLAKLKELKSPAAIQNLAQAWAARMSTPDYTHSMDGERLNEDWTIDDASSILDPLLDLAKELERSQGQKIYLLVEW